MTKRLIILCGAPGAGKTFFGQELSKSLEASYLDKDTIANPFTEKLLELYNCKPDDWKLANWASYSQSTPHECPVSDECLFLVDNSSNHTNNLEDQITSLIGNIKYGS